MMAARPWNEPRLFHLLLRLLPLLKPWSAQGAVGKGPRGRKNWQIVLCCPDLSPSKGPQVFSHGGAGLRL